MFEPHDGQQYGYGIGQFRWGPNTMSFHGGETPGYNSFMGHDLTNHVTLVVWTNLTVSLDEKPTANALMLKVLDQIYVVSPLAPPASPTSHQGRIGVSPEVDGAGRGRPGTDSGNTRGGARQHNRARA